MRPPRALEIVLVVALVAGGTWLRWHHLGTPSLWWDELVHLRTAEQPTVGDVWQMARIGLAPGAGNAGAVPLDYVALHAWLVATPRPAPADIERHYRMPAFAFAVAALPLAWAVARSMAGSTAALATLTLLATSIPHVLYAVDARFYSLYALATLASLAAFLAVVRRPTYGRAATLALMNVGYVLAALYGIFPIAAEYVVLVAVAWLQRTTTSGRRFLVAAVGGGAVALGVLALYLTPSAVATIYPRGPADAHGAFSSIVDTLDFFGGGSALLAWALGLSLLVAPFVARTAQARALAAVAALSTLAVPAIVVIAHWKHYYYHPRHAVFLLPLVHLTTAIVLAAILDRLRRPGIALLVAAALVLAATLPAVRSYVDDPIPFFHQTKTLRDFRGLAHLIAERTANLAPDERYLLILEKRRPGHLANPMVAFYLDAYGIADRVFLTGTGDPPAALSRLPTACRTHCRGTFGLDLYRALNVGDPFDQSTLSRQFLRLVPSRFSNALNGAAIVTWAPNIPTTTPPGTVRTDLDNLALFELTP